MQLDELSKEIVKICKILRQTKLVNATHGNVSARLGNTMLITPTGSDFELLDYKDIVLMDIPTGKVISQGKPSKEYEMHLLAYRKRPDISAVIHAHCPKTVALSCTDIENMDDMVPAYTLAFAIFTKHLPLVGYYKAGSLELAQNATDKLIDKNAVALKHHGIIVVADTLIKALYRVEEIEENSDIALSIGTKCHALNSENL